MLKKNNPSHLAVILDGNKRWAKKNNLNIKKGYEAGFNSIENLLNSCQKLKIEYLTLFVLSSENIKRKSVYNIFNIIYNYFERFLENIINERKISIQIIGSTKNLPVKVINIIKKIESLTSQNKSLKVFLAFNYGFKQELVDAINNSTKIYSNNKISLKNINKLFYLKNIPDPDLLIRTGGKKRLSNFIMFNLTYTELFFTDTLWPDFDEKELKLILSDFKNIDRNYGL